jgi:hypothetical protein
VSLLAALCIRRTEEEVCSGSEPDASLCRTALLVLKLSQVCRAEQSVKLKLCQVQGKLCVEVVA